MKNFYKVQFGYTHGKKFTYCNDCQKIEGFFQCKLVPVTQDEALSLPLPPGATFGSTHQYFIPTITNPEQCVVSEIPNGIAPDFRDYDFTNVIMGGNEFLLTDKTLQLYKITPECAKVLLSNMFFMTGTGNIDNDTYSQDNKEYYGNGLEFNYGCRPFELCMYGNVTVDRKTVFTNDDSGEISFFANVWSKDADKDAFKAYVVFEYDKVVGGYYSSLETCHQYTTQVIEFGKNEIYNICHNPNSYNTNEDLEYSVIEYAAESPSEEYNCYSWGNQRENLLDTYYPYVFVNPSTKKIFHNAFSIVSNISSYRISGVYDTSEKAIQHAQIPSHTGKEVANVLELKNVFGWNDKSSVSVPNFNVSQGLIKRVELSWQSIDDSELMSYKVYLNNAFLKQFDSDKTSYTHFIEDETLYEQTLYYSIVPIFKDNFGLKNGAMSTQEGNCLSPPIGKQMQDITVTKGYATAKVSFVSLSLEPEQDSLYEFDGYYDEKSQSMLETFDENGFTCFIVNSGATDFSINCRPSKKTIFVSKKYHTKSTGEIIYTDRATIVVDFLVLPNMIGTTVMSSHNGSNRKIEWSGIEVANLPEQIELINYVVKRNGTTVSTTTTPKMAENIGIVGMVTYRVEAVFNLTEFGQTMQCKQYGYIDNGAPIRATNKGAQVTTNKTTAKSKANISIPQVIVSDWTFA